MLGDMPLPAKFFIAFVIVLLLIGVVAWLLRRFSGGTLSSASGRSRQARLGVIETASVDSRRRLLLVRRDNVEHLIMLGGPSDLVIEANIVRAHAAAGPARAPEPTEWQSPADESWPAAPEPAARPTRGAVPSPAVADDLPLQPYPEPAAREPLHREPGLREPAPRAGGADRLSGLAAELARTGGARLEPQIGRPDPMRRPTEPRRAAASRPVEEPHAGDEHLASMAQQLEAALRRPGPTAPMRDSAAEPRAGLSARRAGEQRERHSLIERAKQARSAASLATPRARDVKPPEAPPVPPLEPVPEIPNIEADVAMVDEPLPPPPVTGEPPEPVAETSEPESPQGPAEHVEQPAETKSPSLEEEMANLLGRSPGRT
jgi:hypothetical protein